jgi:hypothetical protein
MFIVIDCGERLVGASQGFSRRLENGRLFGVSDRASRVTRQEKSG